MNAIPKLSTMKALVYHGPGKKTFEDHAKPEIPPPPMRSSRSQDNHLRHRSSHPQRRLA